jgi:hypothetical protein
VARAGVRIHMPPAPVCERTERGDVFPGARRHEACEKDTEGGGADAVLVLLGGLTLGEDVDIAMEGFGKVAIGEMRGFRQRRTGGGGVVICVNAPLLCCIPICFLRHVELLKFPDLIMPLAATGWLFRVNEVNGCEGVRWEG